MQDDLNGMGGVPQFVAWLANWANAMVFPICWHDRTLRYPKAIKAASCFALKFPGCLVGVTAAHVVRTYQSELKENSYLTCQLRHLRDFDLGRALIDIDDDLDIATFSLTERQLVEIRNHAFDCQHFWPPPALESGKMVSFAGFPEFLFATDENLSVSSRIVCGGVTPIADLSDNELLMAFDPRKAKGVDGIPLPPLDESLSGCSGGPVLVAVVHPKTRQFDCMPVGIIICGSRKPPDDYQDQPKEMVVLDRGESAEFDLIIARRTNCIRPDGKLNLDFSYV
jgi:hypothetical protein